MTLFLDSGAIFSEDRKYRQLLWRIWDTNAPLLNCLMLNPSKAGEAESDPTVTRQIERARILGCGGLLVTNAYDMVSTDPNVMKRDPAPKSQDCDKYIVIAACRAMVSGGTILCAWGRHCTQSRHNELLGLLREFPLKCLDLNKDGTPIHPLYKPYSAPLLPFPRVSCALCDRPACNGGCLH